ncbi:MAG TPA: phenylalanine--tRNA ligase beta subunit-related protein, partial [Gemmatimonadaceae bacterium]|nr:phenylalanine--tRNA ligase beta subunit-related protein [Gemmatimonadaceae bacterium]
RTRRDAGLSTDASYRFERGVDPALAPRALERVAALIISLAGGSVAASPVDLYAGEQLPTPLVLRASRVERVLGIALPAERIAQLLRAVGCHADVEDAGAAVRVVAPTWRRDLQREVDLLEEVARLHGYDRFPDDIRPYRPGASQDAPLWGVADRLRTALGGEGLLEARPTPFVSGGEEHIRVLNPLAENEAHLRRTVLESLARRAELNLAHMEGNVRLYEIGSVFQKGSRDLPDESVNVGILLMGDRRPAHFTDPRPAQFDAWDAKWFGELTGRVAFPQQVVALEPASAGSQMLWRIVVDGEERGAVRRLELDAPVWAAPAYGVELVLGRVSNADVAPAGEHAHGEPVARASRVTPKYRPLPTTPASVFDLALLVPDDVRAADVERVIRAAAGDLLERLDAFDLYDGDGVPERYRSIAWRLTLRHPERTLREKEIEGRRSKILSALQTELNARQRTS